jgi:dUTP pyrophosphatase
MTTLKMFRTHPSVKMPEHQTTHAACFDVAFQGSGKREIKGYSSKNKPVSRLYTSGALTISPGDRILVPTGLILEIPEGYSVRLHARSGLSLKQGLVLANAEGVIDSDYIDEVFVLIHNISENAITIKDGDRVAQAELVKNETYVIEQTPVRPIPKSNRAGGFGSTGVSTIAEVSNKQDMVVINIPDNLKKLEQPPVKRGRGRPRKNATSSS